MRRYRKAITTRAFRTKTCDTSMKLPLRDQSSTENLPESFPDGHLHEGGRGKQRPKQTWLTQVGIRDDWSLYNLSVYTIDYEHERKLWA